MATDPSTHQPAMTEQQRKFTVVRGSRLATYRELVVGRRGWLFFSGFELYSLLFSNLSSLLGVGLRSIFLPLFLARHGAGTVLGRGVGIRQPSSILIGSKVIIDDYAMLDVRSAEDSNARIEIGDHVFLGKHSILAAKGGSIEIAAGSNISSNCRIATQSSVSIGESVLVAAYCYIGPGNHSIDAGPIIEQEMEIRGGVKIGARSWIGTRATILDGVEIGEDAVVGAHSLVKDNVPARAIVAGVPAKVIGYREKLD